MLRVDAYREVATLLSVPSNEPAHVEEFLEVFGLGLSSVDTLVAMLLADTHENTTRVLPPEQVPATVERGTWKLRRGRRMFVPDGAGPQPCTPPPNPSGADLVRLALWRAQLPLAAKRIGPPSREGLRYALEELLDRADAMLVHQKGNRSAASRVVAFRLLTIRRGAHTLDLHLKLGVDPNATGWRRLAAVTRRVQQLTQKTGQA